MEDERASRILRFVFAIQINAIWALKIHFPALAGRMGADGPVRRSAAGAGPRWVVCAAALVIHTFADELEIMHPSASDEAVLDAMGSLEVHVNILAPPGAPELRHAVVSDPTALSVSCTSPGTNPLLALTCRTAVPCVLPVSAVASRHTALHRGNLQTAFSQMLDEDPRRVVTVGHAESRALGPASVHFPSVRAGKHTIRPVTLLPGSKTRAWEG